MTSEMQTNIHDAAHLLKTMSHPARLQVLCQLTENEVCVSELWEQSELSQSAFSQHLAVLRNNKLIKFRKSSQHVFYSIADEKVKSIIKTMHELFCE